MSSSVSLIMLSFKPTVKLWLLHIPKNGLRCWTAWWPRLRTSKRPRCAASPRCTGRRTATARRSSPGCWSWGPTWRGSRMLWLTCCHCGGCWLKWLGPDNDFWTNGTICLTWRFRCVARTWQLGVVLFNLFWGSSFTEQPNIYKLCNMFFQQVQTNQLPLSQPLAQQDHGAWEDGAVHRLRKGLLRGGEVFVGGPSGCLATGGFWHFGEAKNTWNIFGCYVCCVQYTSGIFTKVFVSLWCLMFICLSMCFFLSLEVFWEVLDPPRRWRAATAPVPPKRQRHFWPRQSKDTWRLRGWSTLLSWQLISHTSVAQVLIHWHFKSAF